MYDEPTAGLDPVASTVVEDLIRSLQSQRGMSTSAEGISSYIVVTHQHSTIRRAVDRLIFLHEVSLSLHANPLHCPADATDPKQPLCRCRVAAMSNIELRCIVRAFRSTGADELSCSGLYHCHLRNTYTYIHLCYRARLCGKDPQRSLTSQKKQLCSSFPKEA